MSVQVRTFPDATSAAHACGAEILERLAVAREERGSAALAVSGGTTPRIMFQSMAGQKFDWNDIDLFWVDERCVPVNDPQSNFRMTRESLLGSISIAKSRVHRIPAELLPAEAARLYTDDIENFFHLAPGELPVFDVIQRGMGPDMHTASLFPGEPLIGDHSSIAAAVWVQKMGQHRVTLLPGVLERARLTVCLVTGTDKAQALNQVLRAPLDPVAAPSQISSPEMVWFIDRSAGSLYSPG